jgi:dienelactone hydrolase
VPALIQEITLSLPKEHIKLEGALGIPENAHGIVLFAHGSGSSRRSKRNNFVAQILRESGIGTLLFDLLTGEEDQIHDNRFNIELLTQRLLAATQWIKVHPQTHHMKAGYFGASTGAAAALQAAAVMGRQIAAVVSRGGRPDLAGVMALRTVESPTLLVVGGLDDIVLELNRKAFAILHCAKELTIIPGATHLFEEPGTLKQVTQYAVAWFGRYFMETAN